MILLALFFGEQKLSIAAPVKYKASQNLLELERKLSAKDAKTEDQNLDEIRIPEPDIEKNSTISIDDLVQGNSFALLIGIDEYRVLPNLATAVSDVESISEILRDDYGFTTKKMLNPTRSEIIKELSRLRSEIEPNDKLLIYFAGHGWLDEEADEGYWLPIDAERSDPANCHCPGIVEKCSHFDSG